ncbi:isoamylase early set domain-containing protein [Candidatus Poribacteria bacterium]|nr:isoamylase early set domain-containing protein [Candidatus Poribacteria bacterium]
MKNCSQYQNLIDIYFDKMIDEQKKNELFIHLKECDNCNSLFKEMEYMEESLASLPDLVSPDNFSNKVMNIIRENETEISFGEKLKNFILSPITLRVNLACITVLLLFIAIRPQFINKTKPINIANNSDTNTNTVSNEVISTKFYLSLPANFNNIENVSVVGDFNGWDVNSFKLVYKGNGIWEGSFPLKPGKYEYMFVINGQKWIPDPKAKEYKEDGFGGKNSLLVL